MLRAFIVGAILAIAGTAVAGYKWGNPVMVTLNGDGSGAVYAHVGHAYNSADTVEFVWCRSYNNGATAYISCLAKTSAGVYGSCYNNSPNTVLHNVITSIQDDSYLVYSFSTSGVCTFVDVFNGSQWHPKKPP